MENSYKLMFLNLTSLLLVCCDVKKLFTYFIFFADSFVGKFKFLSSARQGRSTTPALLGPREPEQGGAVPALHPPLQRGHHGPWPGPRWHHPAS